MTASRCSPKMGGVERHVEAIRTELAANGHEVSVDELGDGVRALLAVPRLAFNFCRRKYDVVHAHDFLPAMVTWLALLLAGRRPRIHATIHGYEGYPLRKRYIFGHRLAHCLAKKVIAVGAYIDIWYGTKSKAVIHGGVGDIHEASAPTTPRVVFVGRLAPDTNCVQIANGFISIARQHADVRFEIYGFGPLAEEIAQACLGTPVDFCGPTSDAESVVAGATIVVANSYLAILEAFSRGKAVVSYYGNPLKRDYLNEIAAASSAMLVCGSPDELNAAISRLLLSQSGERERLASSAIAYAKRFLWRNVAADYLQIWGIA